MNKPFERGPTTRGCTWALLSAAVVAACTTAPPGGTPAAPASAAGASAQPSAAPAPEPQAPAPEPLRAALTPAEQQTATAAALTFLEAGQEEQAEAELKRVLQSDPGNRLAQLLMRQIKDDPLSWFGRESFPYRVQPNETLSIIAKKYMGDLHLFYALARYNNIKVPSKLASGLLIKVPGKAPAAAPAAPAAPPPPPPAPPVQVAPPVVAAPAAPAAPPTSPAPSEKEIAKQKADAVARHSRAARAAMAKDDLPGAIRAWDAVLAIDPENRTAQLERQRAVRLYDAFKVK